MSAMRGHELETVCHKYRCLSPFVDFGTTAFGINRYADRRLASPLSCLQHLRQSKSLMMMMSAEMFSTWVCVYQEKRGRERQDGWSVPLGCEHENGPSLGD